MVDLLQQSDPIRDSDDVPASGSGRRRRVSRALLWPAGFLLATLLMIPASRPFAESVVAWTRDDAVDDYVPQDGYVHRFRREGWADTHFGRHGIVAIADAGSLDGPAVLIWGDSQVEAFQVADEDKVAQQVTTLSRGHTTGVGIGRGGREIGDYLSLMPQYERLCRAQLHVLVFPHLADAYPEVVTLGGRKTYAFPPHPTTIEQEGVRRTLAFLGLDFAWSALKTFWWDDGLHGLRVRPGPIRHDPALPSTAAIDPAEAEATAAALRSKTDLPVLVLYLPTLPVIEADRVRTSPDPEEAANVAILAAACRHHDVAFIDLTDRLVDAWTRTGTFPRGFVNGVPSQGHLNALGHRVVAEAILAHLAALGPEV